MLIEFRQCSKLYGSGDATVHALRDLDLDKIKTVRDRWAFYRDRRPDAYDDLFDR